MSNLGYLLFRRGQVNEEERELCFMEAAHWFRYSLAEEPNSRDSNFYLGLMYKNGFGVD